MNRKKTFSKTARQTSVLFLSNIVLLGVGLLLKNIQTELLSPEQYGLYAFFTSITSFLVLFYRFGYFNSLQVLLAENNNSEKEKQLIGLGFIVTLLISILFSISLFLLSYIIDDLFKLSIKEIIQLASPLGFLILFGQFVPAITMGTNKVERMPFFEISSRLLFLVCLIVLPFFTTLNLSSVILLNIASISIGVVYIFIKFSPSFKNIKINLTELNNKNKSFGFHLYLGQTAQQTTFKFDEIFITFFVNATQLGYYILAKFIAMPMVMMSQALTASLYKFYSRASKIPNKVFIFNTVWLVLCVLFLYIAKEFLVDVIFGQEFSETTKYIIPISIAFLFQGLYQPFAFLSAKSHGKEIRNIAMIETIINIIGNLSLIPLLGVMGAIYAAIISKLSHFLGLFFYYHRYLKNISKKDLTQFGKPR